jgi:hypothetical protein
MVSVDKIETKFQNFIAMFKGQLQQKSAIDGKSVEDEKDEIDELREWF